MRVQLRFLDLPSGRDVKDRRVSKGRGQRLLVGGGFLGLALFIKSLGFRARCSLEQGKLMPSEPLPWERKEYASKDNRRYERGDAASGGCGGGSSSSTRWRESYQGSYDFYRASPRRHPSGKVAQIGLLVDLRYLNKSLRFFFLFSLVPFLFRSNM